MANESVSIQNGRLLLEGQPLTLEKNTHHDLEHVLGSLGRAAIIDTIETMYRETQEKNPGATVQRPSLVAMDLGNQDNILTFLGRMNRTRLHRSNVEVGRPVLHSWQTIRSFGFTPEIRSGLGSRQYPQNQLLLRNPETDPSPVTPLAHLPEALGYVTPGALHALFPEMKSAYSDHDGDRYHTLRGELRQASEAAVDAQGLTYGAEARAYAQVGLIVAEANMRAEVEGDDFVLNPDGYLSHLTDADEYAYQLELDDVCRVLTDEIQRITKLRDNT